MWTQRRFDGAGISMLGQLIVKIRRADTPFYRRLKGIARSFLNSSMPTPGVLRPAYRMLYWGYFHSRGFVDHSISYFFRSPTFRARCTACGKRLYVHRLPEALNHTKIYLGDDVRIHGKIGIASIRLFDEPRLVIGDRANIGHQVTFMIAQEISMGNDSGIANGCILADNDGHPQDPAKRAAGLPPEAQDVRPIRIGNRVWIGSGSFVGKGVTIGDGAIVAANSTVLTDVPPYSVVLGNPARVIVKDLDKRFAAKDEMPLTAQAGD